jgi:hypothetical protein
MRMRKIIATAAVALMVLGGANVALANPNGNGAPFGPDGIDESHPAWYGLCMAYYNNSDQAKQNGAPFQALEAHDWDESDYEGIDDFCQSLRPSNGRGQGNQDDSSAPIPGPRGNG